MIIELVATTLDDALAIEQSGANRITLVSSLVEGGLTPSIGLIVSVVSVVGISVNVMLRPHSAGYVYSNADMGVLERDLCAIAATGASGIITGMLNERGKVDFGQLERLLLKAGNKIIIFGRAIDDAQNIIESVKKISKYEEISAVITAGGKGSFAERMENIRNMREAAPELEIVVAGDIGVNNIADIFTLAKTGSFQAEATVRKNKSAVLGVDFKAAVELVTFARAL